MSEVWFYHLDRWPLERALPALLEKAVGRGWRAVVQASSPERMDALDAALWTYDEASFLPHGTSRDADAAVQPIVLTTDTANPNGAVIRFMVDGTEAMPALAESAYERVMLLFDGNDADERAGARRQWADLKKAGHGVAYWQQNEDGRWDKRG
ncbi:DNA polymerase III subunit chi [Lichenibacterium minor]|uniref:DNA polymerase III subunit chi n=1 Tax=Lichenibacterium minor TaxID=2316528 RepID=A0A4Q2UAK7_9HYPH|nr:DNA polymerase III subunit chi [Lichenibacterium minor]RYC32998.1 DNA polymerase III subunit chi [Lichenibacterium minor]